MTHYCYAQKPFSGKRVHLYKAAILPVVILLIGLLSACAPIIHNRGYVFSEKNLAEITRGVTDKQAVRDIMGTPSSIATVDGDSYYYMSNRNEVYMYRRPVETHRRIVAIYFDDNDIVRDMASYGLEDGNIITYIERETPTLGKELSLLAQLFGNLGRFNAAGDDALGN